MSRSNECDLCGVSVGDLRPYVLRWAPYPSTVPGLTASGRSSGTTDMFTVCDLCDGPDLFPQLCAVLVAREPNRARSPRVPHLAPFPQRVTVHARDFYYCTSCDECSMFEPRPIGRDRLCASCGTNTHLLELRGLAPVLSDAMRNETRGEGLVRLVPGVVRR